MFIYSLVLCPADLYGRRYELLQPKKWRHLPLFETAEHSISMNPPQHHSENFKVRQIIFFCLFLEYARHTCR